METKNWKDVPDSLRSKLCRRLWWWDCLCYLPEHRWRPKRSHCILRWIWSYGEHNRYGNPLIQRIPQGDCFFRQGLAASQKWLLATFSVCVQTRQVLWSPLFLPEVFVSKSEGRDGIDFSKVLTRRWEKNMRCLQRKACAIDCSEHKCPLCFRVIWGLKEDLCIESKKGKGKGTIVASFCERHTEIGEKVADFFFFEVHLLIYCEKSLEVILCNNIHSYLFMQ